MADRLDLPSRHRNTLEALLREHLPDVEVWAYGSRVNGRGHGGSDLDLVMRGPGLEKIPAERLADFADAVRESSIPFLVEARDWARLPERFRREIARDHVSLPTRADANPSRSRWSTATIAQVAEKVGMGPFGSSIKVETFVPDGVPIISGQHLHGSRLDDSPGYNFITEAHAKRLANAIVSPGDIVFTHRGNIGQVAYVPDRSKFGRYVVSQSQFYVRCDHSKVIPEFVAAYFRSPEGKHKLLANASQVGVPAIAQPVTYLRTIDIPLPGLAEQRAIAHILGALDDKIELNRRMNETLEAMARALFKSWFVDFEPVRAKIAGRAAGLPRRIASLFPQSLTTIDQRDVPLGWPVKPLGELIELNYGKALRKDKRIPGDFPVLGSGGSDSSHIEPLVRQPTVVVGRKGTVGSIHWAPRGCWPIDTTYYVVSTGGLPMTYIYRLLQHLPLTEMNTDAAVPGAEQVQRVSSWCAFRGRRVGFQVR